MRILFVIHSHTGVTWQAADSLRTALEGIGHEVKLVRLRPEAAYRPGTPRAELADFPAAADCDGLVVAGPVHGMNLSSPLAAWIERAPLDPALPVAAFVTQAFPFPSWGGRQALARMEALLAARGLGLRAARVLNGRGRKRDRQFAELVRAVAGLFPPADGGGVPEVS